jgi:hypothetical protein
LARSSVKRVGSYGAEGAGASADVTKATVTIDFTVISDAIAASLNFGAFRGYETKVQLNM